MASTSFLGEDQTDEDFFDKLVDNEFEVSDYGQNFVDGADSDEVNALSNTSVSEVGTATANHSGEGGNNKCDEQVKGLTSSDAAAEKETLVSGENVSIGSSESVILHEAVEANNDITRNDFIADNAMSKTSEPKNAGVKEVGWSAFGPADASENNGARSYADYFTELEDNSEDPFAKVGDAPTPTLSSTENVVADLTTSVTSDQHQAGQAYGAETNQVADEQNWENLYPGWRYDHNTGQWHQVDNGDAPANSYQESSQGTAQAIGGLDQRSEVSYMQQTAQSAMGTVTDDCTTSSVISWNQVSHGSSTEYPPNMVFDPQYPGWYYDTITQQWHLLESYIPDAPSSNVAHDQNIQNGNASTSSFYGEHGQVKSGYGSQSQSGNWAGAGTGTGAASNYSQQNVNMWQPELVSKNDTLTGFHTASHNQENLYGSRSSGNNYADQQMSTSMGTVSNYADQQMGKGSVSSFTNQQMDTSMGYGNTYPDQQMGPSMGTTNENRNYGYDGGSRISGFQSFVPASSVSQQFNQTKVDQAHQMQFSNSFQNGSHFSSNASETRSSAGRPPHALVSFGFGGKLIVMKDASSLVSNTVYGSQENSGSSVSIINMMDIAVDNNDTTSTSADYFRTLCQQSFPGPLVGGNIGSKELNKWIDERILSCDSSNMEYTKGELLRLLLSLLKIACQHYGKLRSPFGTDPALKESDCPESAVAKLFASSKKNGSQMSGYGAVTHCLQNMPSEGQIRATAAEVQNLLVAGRTKEALQCAQEGQLWGPALVLAAQLGNQFHVDTVRQMAHRQLIAGSPLRTLCLLISGQPADVFSADSTSIGGLPDAANMYQQPAQIGANCMLNDWEQNLAIITANRTKDDELVIIHLGDCLWKEKGEVTAAHICYLVAEANFESYSDTARMCLIGADHWSFPRTYVSPEAIQRTELYEYAKVLGNSQSVLLPFQPYKIIYAYMLAELGKISDSLKYCQAILKSLKTGRAPEVDAWKQLVSSLEERIRTHQQGGYGANLAPAKLVGKLLPFIDRSIHRMIGASSPQTTLQNGNESDNRPMGPRVPNSQSTMAMSSLMPPESTETMGGWTGGSNRMSMHSRSISEPDFGRSPRQVDPATGASPDGQGKASISGGPSRFGRFGSQIFKTIGWVARRSDRQAKLGEKNKFYYDEKLKQWIEEGAAPPVQEATPPPPPTTSFQNGTSDYSLQNALKNESMPANGGGSEIRSLSPSRSSGMPPIPPTSNHFSARARMGVRSRYVDTFNKSGGTPVNLFQSNSAAAPKPAVGANAKFFIPTPPSSCDQTSEANHAIEERMQEATAPNVDQRTAMEKDSSPPTMVTSGIQRYPSMNSITPRGSNTMENGSLSSRSRRTASWSGSVNDAFNPAKVREVQPLGEALGMPPSSFMARDDLHEVEL